MSTIGILAILKIDCSQRLKRCFDRPLLPIKTSQGLVERSVELDEPEEPASDQEDEEEEEEKEPWKPLGAAEAYAQRLKKIEDLKTALGNTSSNIIEKIDENLDSLSTLLKMYEQLGPDILITRHQINFSIPCRDLQRPGSWF